MKNLKNKIKNMKGITLISLVITIVVLIILAGITLNMLLGENGIINRTKTAKEENEKATASETMTLKITEYQMKSYAENGKLPDLQYLADRFCEDNDIAYVNLKKQDVGAINNKISIGENTSIFTKLEKYPYEFEINSSLQLASIDGVKVASIPENDGDPIVSMTMSELQSTINTAIDNKLKGYSKTTDISSTYATKDYVDNKFENTEWTTLISGLKYKKKNGFVILGFTAGGSISISANTPNSSAAIATLPEGYRPSSDIDAPITYGGYGAYSGSVRVTTDGGIHLCGANAGTWISGNVVFPVD